MIATDDPRSPWSRSQAWASERLRRLGEIPERPLTTRGWVALAAVVLAAVAVAAALPDSAAVRAALAVVLGAALAVVCVRSFEQGLFAVTGWLLVLGLARRLVSTFQADPSNDPLLLVAPVGLAVLVAVAFGRGAWRSPRWLAWGVVAFSALMVLQVLNPRQGSLRAAVGGLLFWLVPMVWFWVGRAARAAVLDRLLAFIAAVATAAGAYGLWQALVGFPSWDRTWIDTRGYIALQVNGPDTLRQFGWSASSGEYALTLSIAIVLCALFAARALMHAPRRWSRALPPVLGLLVLCPALALASVRTAVALTAVAFVVVFVAQRQWGMLRATAVAAAAGGALVLVLSRIDTDRLQDRGVQGMVRRTIRGLGHPLSQDSTLRTHLENVRRGLEYGWHHPLGVGTAAATLAGDRLEGVPGGTENDVSNAAIAFGLLGAAAVVYLTVTAFVVAFAAVRRRNGLLALANLGVLVLSLRFWWNGAHYAPSALLWLLLGWADALVVARPTTEGEAAPATPVAS